MRGSPKSVNVGKRKSLDWFSACRRICTPKGPQGLSYTYNDIAGDCPVIFWKIACGKWKPKGGKLRLGCGKWKPLCGKWKMACGKWKVVCGKWKIACGEWKSAKNPHKMMCGEWKMDCGNWNMVFSANGKWFAANVEWLAVNRRVTLGLRSLLMESGKIPAVRPTNVRQLPKF